MAPLYKSVVLEGKQKTALSLTSFDQMKGPNTYIFDQAPEDITSNTPW